jgi:hypothetical protein
MLDVMSDEFLRIRSLTIVNSRAARAAMLKAADQRRRCDVHRWHAIEGLRPMRGRDHASCASDHNA